jgi:predicted transcriptional regulator
MQSIPVAREIMCRVSHVLHRGQDILEAIKVLYRKRAAAAPVVDEENRLVGLLTEKDCLRVLSNDAYDHFGLGTGGTVSDYMSPLTQTLEPDMDLFSIASVFLKTNFQSLPVLEGERVLGYVSRQGMLSAIVEMERRLASERARDRALVKTVDHPESIGDFLTLTGSHDRKQLEAMFSKRRLSPGAK